jgi:NAD(P)-dependent dehydrogenase (short-subunit alcohol dehydrogenase family)
VSPPAVANLIPGTGATLETLMTTWTANDIPDLDGKTAIVTGANSGLGFQAARQLAAHGADVVLACRDAGRGQAAVDRLLGDHPDAHATLAELDLADLTSVRTFAARWGERPLDLLVNNAGVMALPRRTTADGFEMQFGTNHLGHFALTGLLLPHLLASGAPRVVTVSSMAHAIGRIRFDDLQGERRYGRWLAYGQSKLANLLFAFELDRRARRAGLCLVSAAAHPGYAATNLQTAASKMDGAGLKTRIFELGNRIAAQTDADGALPALYAATAPDVQGGTYWGPTALFGMRGAPGPAAPTKAARDEETARRLWEVSEELTGVRFDALTEASRSPET